MFPELTLEYRVIIGISAMVLLFSGFLISFITTQRKKLQYHKDLQKLNEQQQKYLLEQNTLLEQRVDERTSELNQQKEALQSSLTELKATQIQLIQKEKMASLGELTAGIAHEIQNPLNFVNNFSEVSIELMQELEQESNTGNFEDVRAIAVDILENLIKINLHGRRADAIVKGMLLHSSVQHGDKAFTELNALVDEYLRLAYESMIAKHVNFQCQLLTTFDSSIGKIEVVAPEIGKVLLNLFSNAFYAIHQRSLFQKINYEPTLWVSTHLNPGMVHIKVRDNGTGISVEEKSKIFQPFFTTKPTGEGTGLGLSLSYEIVTRGHGGDLWVESTAGEGSEFVISLPNRNSDVTTLEIVGE